MLSNVAESFRKKYHDNNSLRRYFTLFDVNTVNTTVLGVYMWFKVTKRCPILKSDVLTGDSFSGAVQSYESK